MSSQRSRQGRAHEALQRYLALPDAGRTIATWRAVKAQYVNEHTDQHCLEFWDRTESLHKAGLPEERAPVKAEHYANGSFPAEL